MKRLVLLALGLLLVSGPAFAQDKKAAADKVMTATGSVTAVSASSITVKGKDAEWTFAVDKATHVSVPGATKKTAAAKDAKAPLEITTYVKNGDTVTVKYHDMGATKHAAEVLVKNSAPAPAKKK